MSLGTLSTITSAFTSEIPPENSSGIHPKVLPEIAVTLPPGFLRDTYENFFRDSFRKLITGFLQKLLPGFVEVFFIDFLL